jgi:glycosyltransferase involved in cell wall biosynthesis
MRGTSGALSWANACGRGVITSDARAFAEEVAGGNGITYQQGDVESLSNCLTRLVLDPGLARQWAVRAGETGQQREWSATARRFSDLFTAACEERTQ